ALALLSPTLLRRSETALPYAERQRAPPLAAVRSLPPQPARRRFPIWGASVGCERRPPSRPGTAAAAPAAAAARSHAPHYATVREETLSSNAQCPAGCGCSS